MATSSLFSTTILALTWFRKRTAFSVEIGSACTSPVDIVRSSSRVGSDGRGGGEVVREAPAGARGVEAERGRGFVGGTFK